MKISIGKKLGILVGILLILFLILGIVSYIQVRKIDKSLTRIAEIEGPVAEAAYEMEINLIGAGFDLLNYMRDRDRTYLQGIKSDVKDFGKYKDKLHKLAETEKDVALGVGVEERYNRFQIMADEIVKADNVQTKRLEDLLTNFQEVDDIMSERIRTPIAPGDSKGVEKLQNIMGMVIDINAIAKNLGNYLKTHRKEYADRINQYTKNFENALVDYQKFRLSREERNWANKTEKLFGACIIIIEAIMNLDKKKEEALAKFTSLRKEMETVLGEEIRATTRADVERAKLKSRRTVHTAAAVILILLVTGGAAGFIISTSITRSITGPIKHLKEAAVKIGGGELNTEVKVESQDEIGELASSFGHMAGDIKHLLNEEKKLATQAHDAAEKERDKSEALDKAYSELSKTHDELKRTQAVLIQTEKLSALGDLGAGVAHEMNNPLTGVLSLIRTYMMEKDPNSEEYKDLKTMEEACDHMAKIIKDFTDFTVYSSEEQIGLNCNDVIESIMSFSTHIMEKQNIMIEKHYDSNLPTITGNKNQLQQVVMNMITNAKDAIVGKGIFKIATRTIKSNKGLFAEMEFSDTGCGINKEDIDKLFDPFFTTKRPGKGVGLGLSIAHTIIKAHHGDIFVKSEPNKGTTFTIRLPAEKIRTDGVRH